MSVRPGDKSEEGMPSTLTTPTISTNFRPKMVKNEAQWRDFVSAITSRLPKWWIEPNTMPFNSLNRYIQGFTPETTLERLDDLQNGREYFLNKYIAELQPETTVAELPAAWYDIVRTTKELKKLQKTRNKKLLKQRKEARKALSDKFKKGVENKEPGLARGPMKEALEEAFKKHNKLWKKAKIQLLDDTDKNLIEYEAHLVALRILEEEINARFSTLAQIKALRTQFSEGKTYNLRARRDKLFDNMTVVTLPDDPLLTPKEIAKRYDDAMKNWEKHSKLTASILEAEERGPTELLESIQTIDPEEALSYFKFKPVRGTLGGQGREYEVIWKGLQEGTMFDIDFAASASDRFRHTSKLTKEVLEARQKGRPTLAHMFVALVHIVHRISADRYEDLQPKEIIKNITFKLVGDKYTEAFPMPIPISESDLTSVMSNTELNYLSTANTAVKNKHTFVRAFNKDAIKGMVDYLPLDEASISTVILPLLQRFIKEFQANFADYFDPYNTGDGEQAGLLPVILPTYFKINTRSLIVKSEKEGEAIKIYHGEGIVSRVGAPAIRGIARYGAIEVQEVTSTENNCLLKCLKEVGLTNKTKYFKTIRRDNSLPPTGPIELNTTNMTRLARYFGVDIIIQQLAIDDEGAWGLKPFLKTSLFKNEARILVLGPNEDHVMVYRGTHGHAAIGKQDKGKKYQKIHYIAHDYETVHQATLALDGYGVGWIVVDSDRNIVDPLAIEKCYTGEVNMQDVFANFLINYIAEHNVRVRFTAFNGTGFDDFLTQEGLIRAGQTPITKYSGQRMLTMEVNGAKSFDLCRHMTSTLNDAAKGYGLKTSKLDLNHLEIQLAYEEGRFQEYMEKHDKQFTEYLTRDVMLLAELLQRYITLTQNYFVHSPLYKDPPIDHITDYATAGMFAYSESKKYLKKNGIRPYCHPTRAIELEADKSNVAGRSDVFVEPGIYDEHPTGMIDVTSQYPTEMEDGLFPIGPPIRTRELHPTLEGSYNVIVLRHPESTTVIPRVCKEGYDWHSPVPFRTSCDSPTVRTHLELGGELIIEDGMVYTLFTDNMFRDYIRFWREQKTEQDMLKMIDDPRANSAWRTFCKGMLCILSGKQIQHEFLKEVAVVKNEQELAKLKQRLDIFYEQPIGTTNYTKVIGRKRNPTGSKHPHPAGGLIYGYARRNFALYGLSRCPNKILCETDSILTYRQDLENFEGVMLDRPFRRLQGEAPVPVLQPYKQTSIELVKNWLDTFIDTKNLYGKGEGSTPFKNYQLIDGVLFDPFGVKSEWQLEYFDKRKIYFMTNGEQKHEIVTPVPKIFGTYNDELEEWRETFSNEKNYFGMGPYPLRNSYYEGDTLYLMNGEVSPVQGPYCVVLGKKCYALYMKHTETGETFPVKMKFKGVTMNSPNCLVLNVDNDHDYQQIRMSANDTRAMTRLLVHRKIRIIEHHRPAEGEIQDNSARLDKDLKDDILEDQKKMGEFRYAIRTAEPLGLKHFFHMATKNEAGEYQPLYIISSLIKKGTGARSGTVPGLSQNYLFKKLQVKDPDEYYRRAAVANNRYEDGVLYTCQESTRVIDYDKIFGED